MKVIILVAVILAHLQIGTSQLTTQRPNIRENVTTTLESPLKHLPKSKPTRMTLFPKKSVKYIIKEPKKRLDEESTPTRKPKLILMPKIDIKPRYKLFNRTEKTTRSPVMKYKVFTVTQKNKVKDKPKNYKRQMVPYKMLIAKNNTRFVREKKSNNSGLTKEINKIVNLNATTKGEIGRNKRNTANVNNLARLPGIFKNYWYIQVPKAKSGEEIDAQEFIFIGPLQKKKIVGNKTVERKIRPKKKPVELKIEDDVEISTDMPTDGY